MWKERLKRTTIHEKVNEKKDKRLGRLTDNRIREYGRVLEKDGEIIPRKSLTHKSERKMFKRKTKIKMEEIF